jgi:hypothetical protein
VLVGLVVVGVASACSSTDDPADSTSSQMDIAPSDCSTIKGFSFVQSTLLPRCSGSTCHDAGNAESVVVLEPATAYEHIVGVNSRALPSMKIVEPGRPSRSFLYRKLVATQGAACENAGLAANECGKQMPLNDWFGLPEGWIEETRAWIACGAKR